MVRLFLCPNLTAAALNMSAFSDFHEEALEEAITLYGAIITYKGTTYRGVVNALEVGSDFRDGGLLETLSTNIVLKRSEFEVAPIAGEKLVTDGKTLRISKVDRDEVSYMLTCVTAAV